MRRRFPALLLLSALFSVLGFYSPSVRGTTAALDPQLLARAQRDGRSQVIVLLDINFQPEGRRGGRQAVRAQRAAIAQAQERVLQRLAGQRVRPVRRFHYTPALALELDGPALAALARDPEVHAIGEDTPVPLQLQQSSPLIGAERAWSAGFSGAGQTLAILDTGVDASHPFLSQKVVAEACFSTTSIVFNSTTLCPNGHDEQRGSGAAVPCIGVASCDHGTHVAGIAAGRGQEFSGVGRDASLIAVQVFSRFSGDICRSPQPCLASYSSDQIAALEYVYGLRGFYTLAAVNMSLGDGRYSNSCDKDSPELRATKAAIDNLRSVGVATIVAAGNSGYPDALSAPACISSAVSVGATSKYDTMSLFSNSGQQLSLLAPGELIVSSVPGGGYAIKSGTSMAAPHVAGAWAVLRQQMPQAPVDRLLEVLQQSGVMVLDPRNGRSEPRIQLDAAIELLQSSTVTPTHEPADPPAPPYDSTRLYLPLLLR